MEDDELILYDDSGGGGGGIQYFIDDDDIPGLTSAVACVFCKLETGKLINFCSLCAECKWVHIECFEENRNLEYRINCPGCGHLYNVLYKNISFESYASRRLRSVFNRCLPSSNSSQLYNLLVYKPTLLLAIAVLFFTVLTISSFFSETYHSNFFLELIHSIAFVSVSLAWVFFEIKDTVYVSIYHGIVASQNMIRKEIVYIVVCCMFSISEITIAKNLMHWDITMGTWITFTNLFVVPALVVLMILSRLRIYRSFKKIGIYFV